MVDRARNRSTATMAARSAARSSLTPSAEPCYVPVPSRNKKDGGTMAELDRREFLTAATLASAGAMMFGASAASAATDRYPAIRKAAEAERDAAIKRLQDWIALPSIAAENRNMK